jgi:EAL domain-containing protein (putative c-di-GMP-specific phosphodiesterase class I)
MRTQLMLDQAVGMPWLEHEPAGGGTPERTPLPSFPFTLGRCESADLTIDSGRVSREHARIVCEGGKYRVRDLGSTNGTFLNGRRIEEAPLEDGDLLVLADVEFGFFAGRPQAPESMATQVMQDRRSRSAKKPRGEEVIWEIRRLHETLAQRAIENLWTPIVRLEDGAVFGYAAADAGGDEPGDRSKAERLLWGTDCRVVARLRHLRRVVAIEEAASLPDGTCVFLKLDPCEIGSPGLAESLGKLRGMLPDERAMVVEVPDSVVSDTPYYRDFRGRLQAARIGIAHVDFAAGAAQLMQQEEIGPDYLKLARPTARAIHRSRERQQQVESLVAAARQIGCEVVAVGLRSKDERDACRRLGCRLGQGELFGGPLAAAAQASAQRPRSDA